MTVQMAPMGKLIQGHVLDVAKAPLERALKDHDSQLYVKWNSKKLKGHGVWEIRRRPATKSVVDIVPAPGGGEIVVIDWEELDIINHVMDLPYLNYLAVTKIKAMDTWAGNRNYWADQLESKEAAHVAEGRERAKQEMRLKAREYKKEIRDFKEMILSGLNPAEIGRYWK